MPHRNRCSRMTPTHFCGLLSDVGNSLIAGADEQILGSPPIVQKWIAVLGWSLSTRLSLTVTSSAVLSPNNSSRPSTMHCDQIIFPNLDFRTISKHISFFSSKWNALDTPVLPQPPTISNSVHWISSTYPQIRSCWRFRCSSLPTQPDEFGVALLSFSDVEPFFDGTRLDWPVLILSC
ncbi:hypothetical protein BLNAU_21634 [Blattamonas nauphoetae]|uniref:Uncharacterized protein n=1 Tax=Blattamonas nauphoetae TaxID=2049346 RepID=A0ABQ9WYG8_9EUKA|nr:hypothetical protein BLNAU_21634 [Blattamonas nauphoetae]